MASSNIRALVDGFVSDLDQMIRDEIRRGFAAALGDVAGPVRATARRATTKPAAKVASAGSPRFASAGRKKGEKRSPAELAALEGALLAHIQKSPGQRVEEIKKILGVPTSDLARPLAKLLDAKKIKTTGQRRGTKYFPK